MSAAAGKLPCPCCGYLVFDGSPGSYELCPVCDWESCGLQLEFATTLDGGPNEGTLQEEQRVFMERTWLHANGAGLPRDPLWRPVDPEIDDFEDFDDPDHPRAPAGVDDALYYWRPSFWRRNAEA